MRPRQLVPNDWIQGVSTSAKKRVPLPALRHMTTSLLWPAAKDKQQPYFIHWMTLKSHLPVLVPSPLANGRLRGSAPAESALAPGPIGGIVISRCKSRSTCAAKILYSGYALHCRSGASCPIRSECPAHGHTRTAWQISKRFAAMMGSRACGAEISRRGKRLGPAGSCLRFLFRHQLTFRVCLHR